jgi:hypothetical protein
MPQAMANGKRISALTATSDIRVNNVAPSIFHAGDSHRRRQ